MQVCTFSCNRRTLETGVKMSHSDYGHHRKTKSTFVKLDRRRFANKGLGHSTTSANNFDRRASTTTQSSAEKAYSHISGERSLPFNSLTSYECNGPRNISELTEQRRNYERMMQTQYPQPCDRQSLSADLLLSKYCIFNSKTQSCTSNQDQVDGDPTMLLQGDAVNAKFLALREFRLQNIHECFGDGRHHELRLQSSPDKFNRHCNNFRSEVEVVNVKPLSMTYAMRQNLLRDQLTNELSTRKARLDFINNGLNKSSALSFQLKY